MAKKADATLEAPGILNWAIEGLAQWRANGLQEPAVVKDATTEYRADDASCLHEVAYHIFITKADAKISIPCAAI